MSLGKSPAIRDIERLARKHGVRALLSLNTEGEPGELLSPNVEASWAHAFDLQHERVSIAQHALGSEQVDLFLETLRGIAKPVYVHSLLGRRAAALVTVHMGLEGGLTGDQALLAAERLGIGRELEELQDFARLTVDQRRPATS